VSLLRRLDHIGVVVRSTEHALRFYRDRLGLDVHSTEEIHEPHVRLTYLDAGNTYVQLVEPQDDKSPWSNARRARGRAAPHLLWGRRRVGRDRRTE
jgi:methylmalonyl-CoA/ethylmalonyl-CoA epimerase